MTDSNVRERLAAKHDSDREWRIESIKRWVKYINANPPEVWGPQQNAIVDGQLRAAQQAGISPSHRRTVEEVAKRILEDRSVGQDVSRSDR